MQKEIRGVADMKTEDMEYPKIIYATEKIGSNGIHCLDYKNMDENVKYIRADIAELYKKEKMEILGKINDLTRQTNAL